jgi:hypothetical protein
MAYSYRILKLLMIFIMFLHFTIALYFKIS